MEEDQGDLELIKLLRKAYFERDGTKQAILEIVDANRRLMLCWQKPGMTINLYMRKFIAWVKVHKTGRSGIGVSGPSTK